METIKYGFLGNLLGFRIKQAYEHLLRDADKELKKDGISAQQFSILAMIKINPGILQSRLIEHLYITRSTCGDLVEQLTRNKLIEQTPIDRRSFGLDLTEKGESVFTRAKKIVDRHTAKQTQHMSKSEITDLTHLLTRFVEQD